MTRHLPSKTTERVELILACIGIAAALAAALFC